MAEADLLDGYELVNCVATGSTAQIWEVKKPGGAQSLAMKLLLPEAFKEAEHKRVLKHEATVGKSFSHPHLINIMDLKMAKTFAYFTMEYFRSPNLKGMIRSDRALVKSKAKRVMECVSQALAHMHEKNWVHKDVKPDNVLLTKGGEVRLIDFSLTSRPGNAMAHAISRKSSISIQGTRTYLAPELIRRERLTHSADIYSLGVLLFEMLTGNPPFRTANPNDLLMMHVRDAPPPPTSIDNNITPEAEQFVLKLLAKNPKGRPATMMDVYTEARKLEFFKKDPMLLARETAEKVNASDAQQMNDLLDSRLDAKRTEQGIKMPSRPKPKIVVPKDLEAQPVAKPAPAAAPPAPVATAPGAFPGMPQGMPPYGYPGMPPMGFPGYPGMPMPGMQVPGMPMPGMPMPGMPMGMPPGMPMPGGQMPPGQMPPGQYPGMPPGYPGMAYPQPGAPQPALAAPPQPAGPAPQPAAPRPSPAPAPVAPRPAPPVEDIPVASIDDLLIE